MVRQDEPEGDKGASQVEVYEEIMSGRGNSKCTGSGAEAWLEQSALAGE